jgi:hypothetical protein
LSILAPFVEQSRAKTKAKAKAILAARIAARVNESEFPDLQSYNVELRAPLSPAPVSPVSPALQLRPKRAWKVPVRRPG